MVGCLVVVAAVVVVVIIVVVAVVVVVEEEEAVFVQGGEGGGVGLGVGASGSWSMQEQEYVTVCERGVNFWQNASCCCFFCFSLSSSAGHNFCSRTGADRHQWWQLRAAAVATKTCIPTQQICKEYIQRCKLGPFRPVVARGLKSETPEPEVLYPDIIHIYVKYLCMHICIRI